MSLCGLDIGTTGCKTVVYSAEGEYLAGAYREYSMLHKNPGWVELDSRKVWRLICEVIAEAAAASKHDPIQAISVSSLGEAMVPVTAEREILDDSILCMDSRGQEYVDELLGKIPLRDFYSINPNLPGINFSMPKLCWIREHLPDIYAKADKFLTWADFACFMLGGEAAACSSLASRTLLLDLGKGDWSPELLTLCGLEDSIDKLAPVVSAGEVVGTIRREIAEKLDLPKKVKIVAGGHDQCCNALGSGVCCGGRAVYGIGTLVCITPIFDEVPDRDVMMNAGLGIEDHVLPGKYASVMYNQGGLLVKWFRNTFAADLVAQGGDVYSRLSEEMFDTPTQLFTLPYFDPTGPPNYVSDGVGAIIGLKETTTRGEILKSIMESVTYYFADAAGCLEAAGGRPELFVATGGGARSDQWLQIKADVFGVPFVRNTTVECTALGAAILAGSGAGLISPDAEGFINAEKTFEPNSERHAIYQQRIHEYNRWVKAILDRRPMKG
jgi:xylulokinase